MSVKKFPYPEYGDSEKLCEEGEKLLAENTLMNELISDQKKRIEALEAAVNKAVRVLVDRAGMSVTEARNFFPPSVFEGEPSDG